MLSGSLKYRNIIPSLSTHINMRSLLKPVLIALLFAVSVSSYAQTATVGDKGFVAKVSQGGMFEVAAGRLAMIKGSTQDVRDFATAEVHDHMLVGAKLKKTAAEVGITFSPEANAMFTAKLQHLQSLSGVAFNQAYLSEMDTLHGIDGAAFAKESTDGGTAAFRAFGAETHRIVLRHIGAIRAVPAN
jgi:putative membrane protein